MRRRLTPVPTPRRPEEHALRAFRMCGSGGGPRRYRCPATRGTLHIPEPFGFDLVTGDLLPY